MSPVPGMRLMTYSPCLAMYISTPPGGHARTDRNQASTPLEVANIAVPAQATFAAHRQLGALRHALRYGVQHALGCGTISALEDHDACLAEGFSRPWELCKHLGAHPDIGVFIDVAIQQHEVEQRRLVVDKYTSSRRNVMLALDKNVRASNCQCPIAVQSMDGPCGGWAVLRPSSKETAIHKGQQREVA